jgi:hypothetical protein
VSFYWAEAEPLPAALTRPLGRWYACMAGTEAPQPRCEALQGEIGGTVACSVYADRPSPCRELQPGEDKCVRARRRHGLPPLGIDLGLTWPAAVDGLPMVAAPPAAWLPAGGLTDEDPAAAAP